MRVSARAVSWAWANWAMDARMLLPKAKLTACRYDCQAFYLAPPGNPESPCLKSFVSKFKIQFTAGWPWLHGSSSRKLTSVSDHQSVRAKLRELGFKLQSLQEVVQGTGKGVRALAQTATAQPLLFLNHHPCHHGIDTYR